jgi:transcriptional regulator with XRE-family HTH domain
MKRPISDLHWQIGVNIQSFREQHTLTIRDLSKQCGINIKQLERIEGGQVNIRLTTVVKLMKIMGTPLVAHEL